MALRKEEKKRRKKKRSTSQGEVKRSNSNIPPILFHIRALTKAMLKHEKHHAHHLASSFASNKTHFHHVLLSLQ